MNANRIVSNEKLMRCVPEDFDLSDLSKRIYILREKLGRENEWRIRTVRGVGYTYVTGKQLWQNPLARRWQVTRLL